ncbi:MAG TPA: hypothetical protein VK176_06045 [Phycisphaerales bacterium]|nr:hypothetical protein [Phycisphaerales bacterium]
MHTGISPSPGRTAGGARPLLLSDLLGDLLWPRVLRSASLALRPQRWVFSTLMLVMAALILRVAEGTSAGRGWMGLLRSAWERGTDEIVLAAHRGDPGELATAVGRAALGLLVDPQVAFPLTATLVLIPLILLWSVGGTAVSRMVAVEYGLGRICPWHEALGFGLKRWSAAGTAMLIAPAAAGFVCFIMAAAGWILLSWPVVQVAGGVLYPIFLAGALCAVLLLVGGVLGHGLFCPAVAAENADGLDAFQRGLAYVVAAPGRLFLYTMLGSVQAVIGAFIVWMIASWTRGVAIWSSMRWISHGEPGAEAGWSEKTADGLVSMWSAIPLVMVGGFIVSAYFAIFTIVFLLLRERADGRDAADLWMPGKRGMTISVAKGPGSSGESTDEGFE